MRISPNPTRQKCHVGRCSKVETSEPNLSFSYKVYHYNNGTLLIDTEI